MFCKNCGTQNSDLTKYCTNCGDVMGDLNDNSPTRYTQDSQSVVPTSWWKKINTSALVKVLVVLGFVAFGVYSSMDDGVIQSNNDAISSMNAGNGKDAISQFQTAAQNATTTENKITTLKNLAYSYSTENQNDKALETFKQVLPLTTVGTYDYYLVLGEIAYLEHSPKSAQENYNKAYGISPEEFQINNALALFYLDVEDLNPQYVDYPKALNYAIKARSLDSSNTTLENLGIAYLYNENYTKSLELLSQINLAQHPYLNIWIGLDYVGDNDVVNAKKYFQQYIDTGGKTPPEVLDYMRTH